MNKRTKQLWEESQQWNGSDDGRGGLKILESVEKFAELIVAECMQLNSQELSITAIERLLPLYKEHFGVAE